MEKKRDYFLLFSILIAAILIASSFIYNAGRKVSQEMTANLVEPKESTSTKPKAEISVDDVILGNPEAPITIINFSDFQCPFCQKFYLESEPTIREKYIKTGKVKMVFRALAFLGQESVWAAEAAECAKDQGKYWQYHDYLFKNWNGENRGAFSKINLKKIASDLGLSIFDFNACFDGGKYKEVIANKQKEAQLLGVRATPTFFIQDKMIQGALALDVFEQAIEKALAGGGI